MPAPKATTNSRHEFPIVPNLTRGLVPTGLDQIWVADITYVRLAGQFVYLAVVLDAFSRKVIGWALADHLEASLAIEALDMALTARNPAPGLIHHSDRGVQYACGDYGEKLAERGVLISMSRAGNPYDNAKAERFMRTLKEEEVNGKTYASIDEARTDIGAFLEIVYNRGRLHPALGYKPPVEFEAELRQLVVKGHNQSSVTQIQCLSRGVQLTAFRTPSAATRRLPRFAKKGGPAPPLRRRLLKLIA